MHDGGEEMATGREGGKGESCCNCWGDWDNGGWTFLCCNYALLGFIGWAIVFAIWIFSL
jgi:hypothetical protein